MTEQYLKNLNVPDKKVDVIIDTDAFNEIDDQFAISYLLRSDDALNTVAIYAAPFLNENSESAADGMEKSYNEILKLLSLAKIEKDVFRGSTNFLENENTPVISDAAQELAKRAESYSPENPLYIVSIGAITNIASALLINPDIAGNIVIVWLGGHALHFHDNDELNMREDVAAARIVFNSDAPLVLLPCEGVVRNFSISGEELKYWLVGKNPLSTYLAENAIKKAESYAKGKPWTRVIWDVTAVAWLLNHNDRFMLSRIIPVPTPEYNLTYTNNPDGKPIRYVYHIYRDNLMEDMINKLTMEF